MNYTEHMTVFGSPHSKVWGSPFVKSFRDCNGAADEKR